MPSVLLICHTLSLNFLWSQDTPDVYFLAHLVKRKVITLMKTLTHVRCLTGVLNDVCLFIAFSNKCFT